MEDDTKALLMLVADGGRGVAARLAAQAGISRQAASARLGKALRRGLVLRHGVGAGVVYTLAAQREVQHVYARSGLSEDHVWQQLLAPMLADLAENVRDVWRFGLTEMINNAVDHSGAAQVQVGLRRDPLSCQAWVVDDGEGIFLRIQRALGLLDAREAILELAKGKFTTDPTNHSGEGIFFAARVFDRFCIRSHGLQFVQDGGPMAVQAAQAADAPGTGVFMQLANDSGRTTREVFDRFAAPEEYSFAKTQVPVLLAQHADEKLVSRSQGKRLTLRLGRFQTVVLDFAGVADIGQAFADQVFRVFQAAHPDTQLQPINMAPGVATMVARALAAGRV